MDGVQLPQGYSHFEEAVYFLPFSSQKFLVLILSTSEGWRAESTLESPSSFDHMTTGSGIQRLNHWVIAIIQSKTLFNLPSCCYYSKINNKLKVLQVFLTKCTEVIKTGKYQLLKMNRLFILSFFKNHKTVWN